MKQLLLWLFILAYELPRYCYRWLTRRAYYVTGTFLLAGQRKFFRIILYTNGNVLPIDWIEEEVSKMVRGDRLIVLDWRRIPLAMGKKAQEEPSFS